MATLAQVDGNLSEYLGGNERGDIQQRIPIPFELSDAYGPLSKHRIE